MSDLAAQLELSRNLYDELFSQTEQLRAELQQVIDALREAHGQLVAHCCGGDECRVHDEIRDALVKLGEQP